MKKMSHRLTQTDTDPAVGGAYYEVHHTPCAILHANSPDHLSVISL
jgi:hypothetical protein